MIDSETGLPYDWSNPQAPPTQAASTQPVSAPTPVGQGAGQGGGISPLWLALMRQQGSPGLQGGSGLFPLLMQYWAQGGGGGAASMQPAYGMMPGAGTNGQALSPIAQYLMGQQQPQQPQFGAPTPDQQSWMTQMGWGSDLNALTPLQRGGLNTALGTTNGPQALANAQYGTPQDFVNQWQKMFGST